jgi:hypothetical protein
MTMPADPMKADLNRRESKVVDVVVEIGCMNLVGRSQALCTRSASKAFSCMEVLTHQMETVSCIEEVGLLLLPVCYLVSFSLA